MKGLVILRVSNSSLGAVAAITPRNSDSHTEFRCFTSVYVSTCGPVDEQEATLTRLVKINARESPISMVGPDGACFRITQ